MSESRIQQVPKEALRGKVKNIIKHALRIALLGTVAVGLRVDSKSETDTAAMIPKTEHKSVSAAIVGGRKESSQQENLTLFNPFDEEVNQGEAEVETETEPIQNNRYANIADVLGEDYRYHRLNIGPDPWAGDLYNPDLPEFQTTSQMQGEGFPDAEQQGPAHWWPGGRTPLHEQYRPDQRTDGDGLSVYELDPSEPIKGEGANLQLWISFAYNDKGQKCLVIDWDNASFTHDENGEIDLAQTILPDNVTIRFTTSGGRVFEHSVKTQEGASLWQVIIPFSPEEISNYPDVTAMDENVFYPDGEFNLEEVEEVLVELSDPRKTLTYTITPSN
jgi:hypothetical protein